MSTFIYCARNYALAGYYDASVVRMEAWDTFKLNFDVVISTLNHWRVCAVVAIRKGIAHGLRKLADIIE